MQTELRSGRYVSYVFFLGWDSLGKQQFIDTGIYDPIFGQATGASIYRIRSDLEIVADFQPHVCILQTGTNDIGAKPKHMKDSDWEEHVAGHLYALAEHLATNTM